MVEDFNTRSSLRSGAWVDVGRASTSGGNCLIWHMIDREYVHCLALGLLRIGYHVDAVGDEWAVKVLELEPLGFFGLLDC